MGDRGGSTLLADAFSYAAPALRDIDGDGFEDLVTLWDAGLAVFLGGARGFAPEPSRVETFPEAFGDEDDVERDVRLVDVDGDARLDLVARIASGSPPVSAAAEGRKNVTATAGAISSASARKA